MSRPPENREARVGSAGFEVRNEKRTLRTSTAKCPLQGNSQSPPHHHNRLLIRLDYARRRLDRGVDLMERAIELRQQLQWGLDLDHVRDQVDAFKRDIVTYRQEAS
jgi:hypothetical protein